jgi:hypothetical protein
MRRPYSTDLSDGEWSYIEPHLPAPNGRGRSRVHSFREILDALFYILRSSCQWRVLVLEDGVGNVLAQGHDGIRELYAELFSRSPQLHGEVLNRITIGQYVIDEERVQELTWRAILPRCTRPCSMGRSRVRSPTCGY